MYTNDKITNGGKITTAQTFKLENSPFYVFLYPKAGTTATLTTANMKLNYASGFLLFPLVVGTWNPIVVSELVVDAAMLNAYDVYWGTE